MERMLNKNVFPSLQTDHYPQVVRWTRASGTTGGKGEVPPLAKEGWPRHQVNGPVPLEAWPGWFVQLPIIGGLNQPPRLRPLRRLRGIFLMGAATPPCPGRGLRLSLKLFSMSPCPAKDVGHGKPCKWKMTTPSKVASPHFLDGAATTPPVPGGESVVTPPVSSNPNLNLRHPRNPQPFLI